MLSNTQTNRQIGLHGHFVGKETFPLHDLHDEIRAPFAFKKPRANLPNCDIDVRIILAIMKKYYLLRVQI
jgi:hypothetical protein